MSNTILLHLFQREKGLGDAGGGTKTQYVFSQERDCCFGPCHINCNMRTSQTSQYKQDMVKGRNAALARTNTSIPFLGYIFV